MGNLKKQALESNTEDIQTHELTEQEMIYLRLLNLSLQFHTMSQKIMSGFLYHVCVTRLGYPVNTNLQFEIDLDKEDRKLTVQLVADSVIPEA